MYLRGEEGPGERGSPPKGYKEKKQEFEENVDSPDPVKGFCKRGTTGGVRFTEERPKNLPGRGGVPMRKPTYNRRRTVRP